MHEATFTRLTLESSATLSIESTGTSAVSKPPSKRHCTLTPLASRLLTLASSATLMKHEMNFWPSTSSGSAITRECLAMSGSMGTRSLGIEGALAGALSILPSRSVRNNWVVAENLRPIAAESAAV